MRDKGRKEREMVNITAATAETIRTWLELRPTWQSSELWYHCPTPWTAALQRGLPGICRQPLSGRA